MSCWDADDWMLRGIDFDDLINAVIHNNPRRHWTTVVREYEKMLKYNADDSRAALIANKTNIMREIKQRTKE